MSSIVVTASNAIHADSNGPMTLLGHPAAPTQLGKLDQMKAFGVVIDDYELVRFPATDDRLDVPHLPQQR